MANKSLYEQDTEVRLYRNSIDDIIDEIQAERDSYERTQQARNNAIINSEDPVKKLKETTPINQIAKLAKRALEDSESHHKSKAFRGSRSYAGSYFSNLYKFYLLFFP